MGHSKLILVLTCSAVLACSPSLSTRERLVQEQVLEGQLSAWVRAWNNGARDTLASMYHQVPELTVNWQDGRVVRGWEAEQMAQTELFNSIEQMNLVLQNSRIEILSHDVALATFRHSTDMVRLGGRREPVRSGSGTLLWVRDPQDNVWRIHMEHLSVAPPSEN